MTSMDSVNEIILKFCHMLVQLCTNTLPVWKGENKTSAVLVFSPLHKLLEDICWFLPEDGRYELNIYSSIPP